MPQITRVPLGMQKQLGLQTQGDNPSELGQIITPGFDIQRYYDLRQNFWELAAATVTTDAVSEITVPDGEVWLVQLMSVAVRPTGTTAGDTVQIASYGYQFQNSDSGAFHGLANFGTFSDVGGGGNAHYYAKSRSVSPTLIFFGGAAIRFAYNDVVVTSGSFAVNVAINYVRIEV